MKAPSLQTVTGHPEGPPWQAAIGRVVVNFGTLERVLLTWADTFAPEMKLMQKHHKSGMKQIAPALRRVIESKSSRIPKAVFDEAMAAIAEAIALTAERNEAAHGWLEIADGHFRFFAPKSDSRPKSVDKLQDIEWLTGVAKRIREATTRSHTAMENIAKRHVF
jgi:5,10-methenyltetrahydromethanopterin hydrogenase